MCSVLFLLACNFNVRKIMLIHSFRLFCRLATWLRPNVCTTSWRRFARSCCRCRRRLRSFAASWATSTSAGTSSRPPSTAEPSRRGGSNLWWRKNLSFLNLDTTPLAGQQFIYIFYFFTIENLLKWKIKNYIKIFELSFEFFNRAFMFNVYSSLNRGFFGLECFKW